MSRHHKTFAPRAKRFEAENFHEEEEKKYEPITNQDARISLTNTEVTQITYAPFKNRAFNKIERGLSRMQFSENGLHVLALHQALNKLGYKAPESGSLFWNKTRTELMRFQNDHGIKASGTLDSGTLLKMDEVLGKSGNREDDRLPVSERARMLYEAFEHRTFGIFAGTDEDKVFLALDKLSYEERYELIQYYDEKYKPKRKVGLVKDLYEELGNKDLYKAIHLLYANYKEPQPEQEQEPEHPAGQLLQEVIVAGKGSWIKPKTKYAIEGQPIEFDCLYHYETPVITTEGSNPKMPEVVRRVLIHKDSRVYDLFEYPFRKDIKTFRQDGSAISHFSIDTNKSGNYTFVFIIEDTITKEFRAFTKEYQVKNLEEAASQDLKNNKIQNYSDFRQQAAFIEFNLSKGASKEQKSNPDFYIESATYSENPARVNAADINHIPRSYYSIKGKSIPKDHHYFWFAEINTPKEMFDGASASLAVEYAKNANVHGYKRGEYFGKDGWNMNSLQATAAFLGSLTGVYTIHCLVLDKNNNLTGQEASYRQVILPSDDYQSLKNIREYKKEIDKSFNTIAPKTALAINAVAINEKTTETLSLNLFIGKSKKNPGNYVLTDLTPGVQHQRTYDGNNLKDLFEEFDSKNTYPDGILAYEIPANTLGYPTLKGNFTTDGASFWESLSTGAGWASLGLAVVGLVASFTPAAPIAPYLFIAAGATGATSGTASIIDKVQKGTLTNETLFLDVIMIASSFLGMAGSLSSIAKVSSSVKISSTGMRYIILTDFALNGTAAVMITADGLESIQAIHDNKNLTTAEKIDAIVKILGQLTLTAGLLVLSSKNLKERELEKLPKVKRQTSKQTSKKPYNPEQHSEFIDTFENLGEKEQNSTKQKTVEENRKDKIRENKTNKIDSSKKHTFDESLENNVKQEINWLNENPHWRHTNYGPKPGLAATEQTVASGTVQMELHPNFDNLLTEIEELGYKVTIIEQDFDNIKIDPHVKIVEVTNKKGEFLHFEKEITLLKGMDYETLLHEYGHIKQIIKLENEGIKLATEKGFYRDNGEFRMTYDGNARIWSAIEYHNRLMDLKRLRNLEYAGVKVPKNLIEQTKNAVAKYGTDFSHSLGRRNPGLDSRIEKLKKQIGSIYDEILQLEQNYKY
ncbi:peptidoglycan-binding domain-containing protein [uncultured Chryseobacterium sp.]|uniref:peptidoglycan-binding domain-containing protein n=2 Tax=uncultured Chryseobacterium sp. TaxID=259322 RepID=UPI0025F9A78F|nr:peptidoglycan-binding domain-containing protein [uncultured Chryseobacterium sp.]